MNPAKYMFMAYARLGVEAQYDAPPNRQIHPGLVPLGKGKGKFSCHNSPLFPVTVPVTVPIRKESR